MGDNKRVLVVDDEEKVVFFLRESLEELGHDYTITAARSAEEALEKITEEPYDLVISDLRMPGLNGLELFEKVKEVSPGTHLILMTAYGSDEVEAEAHRLETYEYITKPFHVADLIEVARDALADIAVSQTEKLTLSEDQFDEVNKSLGSLRFEVGARCVLLADLAGEIISEVGITEGLETGTLIPLVASGLATVFKIAQYLGDEETFNLNLYEGRSYDIYSTGVGNDLFLTLVFDRTKQASRIGMVWLYARRTIQDLLRIVSGVETEVEAAPEIDVREGMAVPETTEEQPVDAEKRETIESAMSKLAESEEEPETPARTQEDTFGIEEALRKGLIDEDFAQLLKGEE